MRSKLLAYATASARPEETSFDPSLDLLDTEIATIID
jgi:hypothetical protein